MPNERIRPKIRLVVMAAAIVSVAAFLPPGSAQQARQVTPAMLGQLTYRFIGPQGNRMIAVVGVPGDLNVYYAGAASGGVFKSIDGGINWQPIFDDQPASSVGSLAIAPSDPNIVWAGTGETFIRSNISIGNGIYKSTDAGRTWTHMGLDATGRIGRIVIDPRNPDIVFAAAMGHCYGPQPERGVFRTTDGGKTWEKVLFVDENTGASDIAMDLHNPRVVFAGTWQVDIKTWGRWSGGPGSGVYVSRDGGTMWTRITGHGLPDPPLGKIAVAVAPTNSNRVYALIETGPRGSLWRSDDGGYTWRRANTSRILNERPHYYTRRAVSSSDADEVYFPSNSMSYTLDGGETEKQVRWGGDNHDMWIDPLNADRMAIANDGGLNITTNHGRSWNEVVLPVAQIYHVDVDSQIPYNVYGNKQDGPSYRGPSNSRLAGRRGGGSSIPSTLWTNVAGCESGFAIPDPVDDHVVWGGCYNGGLDRYDLRTRHNRSVRVWPRTPMGSPAGILKYRFNWTFPIAISPHDHNTVYVGSQHVHKTTDGGQTWTVISPDLSLNDASKLKDSGGLTVDNLGVEYGCLVFAIAESPKEKGLIWAGTNDGQVQVTRDGGAHWTNVTANIPGLPPWGTVSNIEPSRYDAGTAYITVDFHQVNNRDPFIYKTTDYGKTWKLISSDIPKSVFSYVHAVREDPVRKGLLYAGTENGLYVSFNDGGSWIPLQSGLPHAPVHWLVVQPHFNDLVVATYGRGFWILDDITPLQQVTPQVLDADAHVFAPRATYRFQNVVGGDTPPNDQSAGENPRYGASINYYLKAPVKGPVRITILDDSGAVVRTLTGPGEAGINRAWWDLRHEPPSQPKLRTNPPGNPHVWEEDRFRQYRGQGFPLISWGIGGGQIGPLAVPGTYTVKLSAGGRELSEKLVVRKDPNTTGTEADIRAQVKMSLELRNNINAVTESINRIEWIRKQLADLGDFLAAERGTDAVRRAAEELDRKFTAVEEEFFSQVLAEGDSKSFRAPVRLYSEFSVLAGDVMSADYPPTAAMVQVHEELKKDLAAARGKLDGLLGKDLAAFNSLLREKNIYGFSTIRELELLQEAGFHPIDIIQIATSNSAEVMKLKDLSGIRTGHIADLIVVDGSPLDNFKLLYGMGYDRLGKDGKVEHRGGVRWTIKAGIVFDAPALLREVEWYVQQAKSGAKRTSE